MSEVELFGDDIDYQKLICAMMRAPKSIEAGSSQILNLLAQFEKTIPADLNPADIPVLTQKRFVAFYLNSIEVLAKGLEASESAKFTKDLKALRATFDAFPASASVDAWRCFGEGIMRAVQIGLTLAKRENAQMATEANKKNAEIRTEKLQLIIRQVCRDLKRRLSASNECANEIRGKVKERVDADKDPVLTAYLGKNHKWPSAKTIKEAIEAMSR